MIVTPYILVRYYHIINGIVKPYFPLRNAFNAFFRLCKSSGYLYEKNSPEKYPFFRFRVLFRKFFLYRYFLARKSAFIKEKSIFKVEKSHIDTDHIFLLSPPLPPQSKAIGAPPPRAKYSAQAKPRQRNFSSAGDSRST